MVDRTLHSFSLCPHSRLVQLVLHEKNLNYDSVEQNYWEFPDTLVAMNPAGTVPILCENDMVISDVRTICEFLDEFYRNPVLLGMDAGSRCETRRLVGWFVERFNRDVTELQIGERVIRQHILNFSANGELLRRAERNLLEHLSYMSWLLEQRDWLAGSEISMADLAAAAQISCIDYIQLMPWENFPLIRIWYAAVKSRPSMREVLRLFVPGLHPPAHYTDPDF